MLQTRLAYVLFVVLLSVVWGAPGPSGTSKAGPTAGGSSPILADPKPGTAG